MQIIDRYKKLDKHGKYALDRLYEYLGFNEVTTFEKYLDFVFLNTIETISFDQILNHTLKHIVMSFWNDNPDYKNSYITAFWINPSDIKRYVEVGSKDEYDPKGLIRHYVKSNFKKLFATKR
jgi:hypothetical protein